MRVGGKILVALLVLLTSAVRGQTLSTANTTITWQVKVDDDRAFDYQKLKVSVRYWGASGRRVSTAGFFVPDQQGYFRITVPGGSKVSVEIVTSDPTVRWKTGSETGVEFYIIEKGQDSVMLGMEQLELPSRSAPTLSHAIEISRAAAIVLCASVDFIRGSIQFRHVSRPEEDVHIVLFRDQANLRGAIVGGLAPGIWEVSYLDENVQPRLSEILDVRTGDVYRMNCR